METDLLGDAPQRQFKGGYAGMPGAGPGSETCGSCAHSLRHRPGNRNYWKCMHMRGKGVTACDASDIRKNAPACEYWEAD